MFINHLNSLRTAALLSLALLKYDAAAAEASAYARITEVRIEKTNIMVRVEASGSLAKITLESSTRVGRKAWEPRAVQLLKEKTAELVNLTFHVPISPAIEILRVRGDLGGQVLPPAFYEGTNAFVAATTGGGAGAAVGAPNTETTGAPGRSAVTDGAARSVVESDIWKLDGDTLYFFNQNRGLQVLDVANPDNPVLAGTYALAAAGEQMYVLDHDKVVLLARDGCDWYGSPGGSRVILLQAGNGTPQLIKELPVSGYIAESRLVGSALYIVANSYEPREVATKDGTTLSTEWEWGSRVLSFDLSDFAGAQQKSKDWVKGYGNVIYATDRFLFVSQSIYDGSGRSPEAALHCYDISAPDGTFEKLSTFSTAGTIRDK
ncbi:MAG TPA: beta-propeller domain-containing protein, partial [Verrucomicrobiae bacterium]|nr:beta-propeller domain-containing protein [Verrucomicrobiae bacterium]